jgi:hypothetical protein
MTNRVLLDNTGLKVSKPGVDVLTAALSDLVFRSDDGGMPVFLKPTILLPTAYGTIGTLSYGKTFSYTPHSMLLHTYDDPSVATYATVVSDITPWGGYIEGLTGVNSDGDFQFLRWDKYVDRIEVYQYRNKSSGNAATLLAGYLTAVIFDYGS